MPSNLMQTLTQGMSMNKRAFGLGSGIEVGSDLLSGIDANKIASRVSGQYEQEAQAIKLATTNQINSEDRQTARLMSSVRANAAASGTSATSGSAKAVNQYNATEQQLKDAYTRYSGGLQANAAEYAAANARWQGKMQEYGSFVQAGTTALTSAMLLGA